VDLTEIQPKLVKMQQNSAQPKMLRVGVSFQEYVSCDYNAVTCEVQTE